jgi:hypothetical protein
MTELILRIGIMELFLGWVGVSLFLGWAVVRIGIRIEDAIEARRKRLERTYNKVSKYQTW